MLSLQPCLIKFHSNEIKELPIYLQKFYKRVFEEVIDDQNPLLEKCKFAAIVRFQFR